MMINQKLALLRSFLFFLPIITFLFFATPTSLNAGQDEIIREIEVKGVTRISEREFKGLVALRVGDILDMTALAKGIKRVFRKGIFQDIKAVSEETEEGVKLKFIVKEIPVIKKIRIQGNDAVRTKIIKKSLQFRERENFIPDRVNSAIRALKILYGKRGYPDAEISISWLETEETALIDLLVTINEGPPLIIESVNVPSELRKYLKVQEGDVLDEESVQRSMERVRKHYVSLNYVNPKIGPYRYDNGTLKIPVRPGKKYDASFEGNISISEKKLKKVLPFTDNKDLSDESVEEAVSRIKRLYEEKGYNNVNVAAGVERAGDLVSISFLIVEGNKGILRSMTFEGISISEDTLRELVPLKENKPYSEDLLEKSSDTIVGFYKALGYMKVKVVNVKKEFENEGRDLHLTVTVKEGLQTKIKEILILGNKKIGSSRLRNNLKLRVGAPYNVIDISDSRFRILSLYGQRGYLDAHVEAESVIALLP
jgi:outer membrane protein insertion porin family